MKARSTSTVTNIHASCGRQSLPNEVNHIFSRKWACITYLLSNISWVMVFFQLYEVMVHFYQNSSDLLQETIVLVIEKKLLTFEAEGWEFSKCLKSLNRTIYSNSERSEQFLITECFFNFLTSCRFFRSNKLEQLDFQLEKIIWI